jgi:hypothetical protein
LLAVVSPQLRNHCPAGYFKDVFNYLVEGKGRKINNYTMLEKEISDVVLFPVSGISWLTNWVMA